MSAQWSELHVGEHTFSVQFAGFDRPLLVAHRDGERVTLEPWSFGRHLELMASHVSVDPGNGSVLVFDGSRFARGVLAACWLAEDKMEELMPLALWWAAGGAEVAGRIVTDRDGWCELGSCRARLRPWTFAEKLRALQASVSEDPSDQERFDAVGYLVRMVQVSVLELEPADCVVEELDSRATQRLLQAVVALNDPHSDEASNWSPTTTSPAAAEVVLRLCRRLGWPASRVLSTPAKDVDLLLRLIDDVESSHHQGASVSAVPPGHSNWAADGESIVIRVEEET